MRGGESEIDDETFFLSNNGKTDPRSELYATIKAFYNETTFDDNSTACRFPARYDWLKEKLQLKGLPNVECREYDKILKRLNPKSATLVFPAAHINSPASMFGHTFLRINSSYNSKLLSYAVNYAADADPDKTNGVIFAIKGLLGGYYGRYSLLPYYDKLKEYRDTEQRNIWEYDLNLNEEETLRMVKHIWELNGTHSYYYFFTENCSYNMLWLMEIARPSIDLKKYFTYQVIPLETIHAVKEENLISSKAFRASKRAILLKYEELLDEKYIHMPRELVEGDIKLNKIVEDKTIPLEQKQYILESAVEFLEYSFSRNDMDKDEYLDLFHNITSQRAALGKGEALKIKTPPNPIDGHRAFRTTFGFGQRNGLNMEKLGMRIAYHDLEDSSYGFLRGTQIEFLNLMMSHSNSKTELDKATIVSISSIAQRSEFFDSFSWRMNLGWDREYLNDKTAFMTTLGFGYSWGSELGYIYFMIDPLVYVSKDVVSGVGGSMGISLDKYHKYTQTNIELTQRFYDNSKEQFIAKVYQSFRLSQNIQLRLNYKHIQRSLRDENSYTIDLNLYF